MKERDMREKKEIEELSDFFYSVDRTSYLGGPIRVMNYSALALACYDEGYRKQSVGEWVDKYHGKYANQVYKCSVCGDTAHSDGRGHWFLTPYCHNCGAKMGGGE